MSIRATAANAAWGLSCLPAWLKFCHALDQPEVAQDKILRRLLQRTKTTEFGRGHAFDQIQNYEDFVSKVPIRDYAEFRPWIDRIRCGEQNVLTSGPVIRLVPTSGTTAARKLIPYTREVQQEFNAAVGAWMVDLFRSDPKLINGPAYWSISPAIQNEQDDDSAVPIGFAQDSEYLGKISSHLIDWAMAIPASVRSADNIDQFRRETIAHLTKCRDLRLISIWHPSFLPLLLEELPEELRCLWPGLRLISCWADGAAEVPAEQLARCFPDIKIQPKGLIATEAIVSIPFNDQHPLTISSHFLEFLDASGHPHQAHELTIGGQYEVVITTGGGLWRYRLNDLVRVDGLVGRTPSIRFIGKCGNISDLRGEKLSEAFVFQVLEKLRQRRKINGAFAMLAPNEDAYILYAEGHTSPDVLEHLEQLLCENPHYKYCRDLGQLAALRLFKILDHSNAHTFLLKRLNSHGQRLGDIKPSSLSRLGDWHLHFDGHFVQRETR